MAAPPAEPASRGSAQRPGLQGHRLVEAGHGGLEARHRGVEGGVGIGVAVHQDVLHHPHHLAQVVEDHHRARDHEAHLGDPGVVGGLLGEALEGAHQVVAQPPHGAGEEARLGAAGLLREAQGREGLLHAHQGIGVVEDLLGAVPVAHHQAPAAADQGHQGARPHEAPGRPPLAALHRLQEERRALPGDLGEGAHRGVEVCEALDPHRDHRGLGGAGAERGAVWDGGEGRGRHRPVVAPAPGPCQRAPVPPRRRCARPMGHRRLAWPRPKHPTAPGTRPSPPTSSSPAPSPSGAPASTATTSPGPRAAPPRGAATWWSGGAPTAPRRTWSPSPTTPGPGSTSTAAGPASSRAASSTSPTSTTSASTAPRPGASRWR